MWRRIKQIYYRRKARRLIIKIEEGYVCLHLLLRKGGYSRSQRRRVVKEIVKDGSLMNRYLKEENDST